jgi:glycine cleavage system H protein
MSAANEVKDDRSYTEDHEWAREDGDAITVGITAFAVEQLGDITLVSFDVAPGDTVEAKAAFGTIESVKTLSDLFAPVTGTIVELNPNLEEQPELVNDDCWERGWMAIIKPSQLNEERGRLLDADGYRKHLQTADS